MKKIIVLFTFLAIFINSANAQSDKHYRRTLKKMLEAGGSEATFKSAIKQMFEMFKQQKTEVPESLWIELENEFLKTSVDDLVEMLSPVYQKYMSESDLEKITEFYHTPVGKKYAENTPVIMQESMVVGQEWGKKIGQEFLDKLQEKGY